MDEHSGDDQRINVVSAIPARFRDAHMFELLVSVNAKNIARVPTDMLSETMMLTALRRDRAHLRHIPPTSRPDNTGAPRARGRRDRFTSCIN